MGGLPIRHTSADKCHDRRGVRRDGDDDGDDDDDDGDDDGGSTSDNFLAPHGLLG